MKIALEKELAQKLGLEEGEYEVHHLSKGVVALSFLNPLSKSPLSQEEISVLRKLTAFRFESRIPYNVNKTLTDSEKKILEGLIRKEFVELYKGGKYSKTGVYNIPRSVYPLIREASIQAPKAQAQNQVRPQIAQTQPQPQPFPGKKLTGMEMLVKFGYAVIDNEMEAREISATLEKKIRAGDYLGVRAFNKKFYVAEKNFYISLSERIRRILAKKDANIEQMCTELKAPEDACTVAIRLMNNDSEVIEKKRGMYGLV